MAAGQRTPPVVATGGHTARSEVSATNRWRDTIVGGGSVQAVPIWARIDDVVSQRFNNDSRQDCWVPLRARIDDVVSVQVSVTPFIVFVVSLWAGIDDVVSRYQPTQANTGPLR